MTLIGRREPLGRAATGFNLLVGMVGLWLLLIATLDWFQWAPTETDWPLAFIFLCLFIFARLLRFEVPPNITASLIVPIQLAAVLLLGPVPTAWLVLPAFLAEVMKERALVGVSGARRRAVVGIIVFNLGMEVVVTLAAGATWRALQPGNDLEPTLTGILSLVLTFLAFKAVNEALMVTGNWLRGKGVSEYLLGARTTVVVETLTLPLAALLVLISEGQESLTFYLFLIGIILAAVVVRGLTRTRADLSAATLRLQRTNVDLERKVREVETLSEVSRAISADIELEALLETIYSRVADILKAHHFFIALHEEGQETLNIAFEVIGGERHEPKDIPLGEGLTSHVVLARRPLLIKDLEAERVFLPAEPLTVDDRPNRSWLGVPMIARGEAVGAIVLQDARAAAHDEEDLRILTAIASQAAISIKNARLHQEAMHAVRVEAENRELKRINAKKSEFVNMVAHQFRTPLTAVIGYTNLLVERLQRKPDAVPGPDLERHLRTVHGESRRLAEMVEELLNLSRIRSGRLPLTMQSFDLVQLAREILDAHHILAERGEHDVRLETDLGDGGVVVRGDSNFLRQALANMVANALKYAPARTPVVVRISVVGPEALVAVEDEGPGVPAVELERLFDEFYRASGQTAEQPGTGLGLSITRGIVEAHGGRTWAEACGQGTAFCFALPLEPAAPASDDPETTADDRDADDTGSESRPPRAASA